MNTDSAPDLRKGSKHLLLEQETKLIIGCAFEVLNELGHGFLEKPYENALLIALREKGVPCAQQRRFPVQFRGQKVGEFVTDLIAHESVVVDTKTINAITDHERGQMLNYLRVSKLRVGLTLNFKHARLQWERVIL